MEDLLYLVLLYATAVVGASFAAASVAAAMVPIVDGFGRAKHRFGGAAPIDGLGLEPPDDASQGDPAFRGYLFGPAYREGLLVARETLDAAMDHCADWLTWIRRTVRDRPFHGRWRWVTAFPAGAAAQLGVLAGAVVGVVSVLMIGLVFGLFLGVLGSAALAAGLVLAVLERGVLLLRGITVECPRCHSRVRNPTYRCSRDGGCDAVHRALVPGTRGVLFHVCRCGRSLPTLLLLGKNRLVAQCPGCGDAQLPLGQQSAPTVHIPVTGGPQVGKSVFMFAAVKRLHDEWQQGGSAGRFWADEAFNATFRATERAVAEPGAMLKTARVRPSAYTLYQGRGLRRRLLYLYDTAGEIYHSSDELAAATFFAHVRGIVLCVDPFSIPAVRVRAGEAALRQVRSPTTNPRNALELVVDRLRENLPVGHSNRLGVPAAVVLTKADGFDRTDLEHPYGESAPATRAERDARVRRWLTDVAGQGSLVASVDVNFATVGFFVTSHREAVNEHTLARRHNDDPAEPIRWLLATGRTE